MAYSLDVLDYSGQHPDLAQVPASITGVARYLRGGAWKQLTPDEVAYIHALGKFIVINDEVDPTRPQLGADAGAEDGAAAGTAARALGVPPWCIIHPSVDYDVTSDKAMASVDAYMTTYRQNSGYGQGGYGEYDVINNLASMELLSSGFGWQTYAWSAGRVSSHAGMLQYQNGQSLAGGIVDFNTVFNLVGLGAWMASDDMQDLVVNDPRGGAWWVTAGKRVGIDSPSVVNDLTGAGAKVINGWDALQIDSIPVAGLPTPGESGIIAAIQALSVQIGSGAHPVDPGAPTPAEIYDLAGTLTPRRQTD